jgi:hypothetical protein
MTDELDASDDVMATGPIPASVVAPAVDPDFEPAPEAFVEAPTAALDANSLQEVPITPVPAAPAPVFEDTTVSELEELGTNLVRQDAKGRALRSLVQSGLLHTLFSVGLVVYPLVHLGHMTAGDWKAIGLLAASTVGHGMAALVMRLMSDPKTQ